MKKYFLLASLCFGFYISFASNKDSIHLSSPNKNLTLTIWMNHALYYNMYFKGQLLIKAALIDLKIKNKGSLSDHNNIVKSYFTQNNTIVESQVPERNQFMKDEYNEVAILFKQAYGIKFRAYNEGVAYQLATQFKDSIYIENEIAEFNFENQASAYIPLIHKRADGDIFHTSFEEQYPLTALTKISNTDLAYNPVLVCPNNSPKIAITESDLLDYPGMFLTGNQNNSLVAGFAPYPAKDSTTKELYPEIIVTKREDYIAYTKGTRTLPWRILMVAEQDKLLPNNNMVYLLASKTKVADASWVHPGKITDEWIINTNVFNVPFKSGVNTATYKYYIDFAKRFGFDRIMMDAGWSDYTNLFKVIPEINMDSLVDYAKKQNIKISMWTIALTLDKQLEAALTQFNKWGVDFIMTDFIDRDDQKMVQFYERIAQACAQHKIMIMFHGAYAPKGFNRTYPNAITREGVLGSEYNIWSDKVSMEHNLVLPFTRMLAGPMDYEPGFLNNATQKSFRNVEGNPMSLGTRSNQLAMYIVYDNPMQFFSGNPSQGFQEPQFMELLGSIPAGWEETNILDAKVGNYIISARRKNQDWYIGGMCDWSGKTAAINLSFLPAGKYLATLCKDGVNADKFAADYTIDSQIVDPTTVLNLQMAPGGGFFVKLIKQ